MPATNCTLHGGDERIIADGGGGVVGEVAVEESEQTEVGEEVGTGTLSKWTSTISEDLGKRWLR